MEFIEKLWTFLLNVFSQSFIQLLSIFGIFFLFGLLLYLFARLTRHTFVKSIGINADIYFTGWIGTPIHELGHAIFCIVFRHRITEMRLFKPNANDQTLGYVNHQYNSKNIYHKIGNFFIGIGPILLGSVVIFFLMKLLVPNATEIFSVLPKNQAYLNSINVMPQQFVDIFQSGKASFSLLFIKSNLLHWPFYIFMYLSLSIASHMELSPPDLKSVASGLITIFILFLIVNAVCLFLGINISGFISKISNLTSMLTGILTLSTILSAIYLFSAYVILSVVVLITKQKLFIPFGK